MKEVEQTIDGFECIYLYADDENSETWVIFRQKYRKSAFILHLYGYIWKVIINKPNGESFNTNKLSSYIQ